MKKAFLISAMFIAASAVGAWAAACDASVEGKAFGALSFETINKDSKDSCVATLDLASENDIVINDSIRFDKFVYPRELEFNQVQTPSTISNPFFTVCLPFKSSFEGGNLYEIANITNNGSKEVPQWQIVAQQNAGTLQPGVPYFIAQTWNNGLVFKPQSKMIANDNTLQPTTFGNGKWTFKGTFTFKKWLSPNDDAEIPHIYGFAAKNTDDGKFKAGQFVKIKAGAYIKPMRAYLYYNVPAKNSAPNPVNGNVLAKAAEEEELPQTIDVIFKDMDGNVMSIAQMNTYTGEVTAVEGWFDLKGRRLNAKPTQKGTYFNNGKKVVIK